MTTKTYQRDQQAWLNYAFFAATAIVCFVIRVANPFNLVPVWPSTVISIAFLFLNALVMAFVLLAGLRYRKLTQFDKGEELPGGIITLGLGLMLLYFLIFDLGYALWLRTGHGIQSKGHFERAWGLLAFGLFSGTLFALNKNSIFPGTWRIALTAGVWIGLYLTSLGLLEGITYCVARLNGGAFSENLEIVIVPILVGVGNSALFLWAISLGVLYLLDYRNKRTYGRLHYVPLIFATASVLIWVATSVAFRLSGNFY